MEHSAQRIEALREKALQAMLAADPKKLESATSESLLAGFSPLSVELQILAPALQEVGNLWHEGKINVAQEHLATQLTMSQMERLRRELKPRKLLGFHAVVTAVEGEIHALGARLVADVLYHDGWSVDFLGADTPTLDLVEFVQHRSADLAVLSVTLEDNVPRGVQAMRELKKLKKGPKVLVGGRAVSSEAMQARFDEADAISLDIATVAPEARRLVGLATDRSLDSYLQRIGERIQSRRKELGWNQSVLASKAGLDRTYISALERGKQNLTLAALLKLAEALDTTLDILVADTGFGGLDQASG